MTSSKVTPSGSRLGVRGFTSREKKIEDVYDPPMTAPSDDLRVSGLRPLLPPAILHEEIPATDAAIATVRRGRDDVVAILERRDHRLLVVVGPCSVHDPDAARAYGERLARLQDTVRERIVVVMRTYFEKPRTVVGWKGLVNDPGLDGSFDVNRGLRLARRLLRDLAEMGLAPGTEWLDPITPQFFADLVAWGAIGARTTESQTHREMASGLSMPVGFKNGTDGGVQIAVDAVRAARHPHHFLGVTKQGLAAIVATSGNPACHVILRGGRGGPNHHATAVREAADRLAKAGLPDRVLVDCSHANSGSDPERQPAVALDVAAQLRRGDAPILGVMIESFLEPGRQDLGGTLTFGKSVTDGCVGWDTTEDLLRRLADAVP
jgi:3-deoxy-7-phosphoheptulonate synthase